jgi:hypothetical protein
MIWLTWRQHRGEALVVGLLLVLLVVILLTTGLQMASVSQQLGLGPCLLHPTATGGHSACLELTQAFENQFGYLYGLTFYLSILPALLGMLVGGPLVARELEQHTQLLVWTQSVPRSRWLAVRLAAVVGAGVLVSGVLLALLIWWYTPFAQLRGRFTPTGFDIGGPVWIAAAVLALTLGVLAGTLTRRTVLAMFLALVVFLGIRLPVEFFLRPHFEPAITVTWSLDGQAPAGLSGDDWVVSSGWLDAQGHHVTNINCAADRTFLQCLQADGVHAQYITYQPADRFWPFQWIETGIYLAVSALAVGLTAWWVRRRIA